MNSEMTKKEGMVDIAHKEDTHRRAVATTEIMLGEKAFEALVTNASPKGDVIETAKVAGIMAAKNTPNIIPMCHPLALTKVSIDIDLKAEAKSALVKATVECLGKTGVEMEALTASSVCALTIYDMLKWADKGMVLKETRLDSKSGGKKRRF